MTAEGEEVATQCLHIHLEMGCALRCVNQHRHAMFMGDADDVVDGIDGAEHIAHMGDADDARAVGEQPFILLHEEFSTVGDGNHTETDTLACLQQLPRHNVGMMLHDRHDDLVTLLHQFAKTARHQVDGLSGATGEDDFIRLLRIDEAANGLAGRLVEIGGLLREVVYTPVDIGIDVEVFLTHRIEHAQRLLRCGGIVEIDQRTVIDRAREYGEILSYF